MATYLFDHGWHAEYARLTSLADMLDPATTRRLEALGVSEGWRCLEVGGGAGTIARWLSQRVGQRGQVVATDLEVKFLEALDLPNLEVRYHDIITDPIEADAYDLVHCRTVLEHMPPDARHQAITHMVTALKPGGCILIEDGDTVTFLPTVTRGADLFLRCSRAFERLFVASGGDPHYGAKLREDLLAHGLNEVGLDGHVFEWGGNLPQTAIWLFIYQRLRERVVVEGLLSEADVDAFLALIQALDFRAFTPILVAAWGRKSFRT